MTRWTQKDAIALCRIVEEICPEYGAHVALTGGCLYKDGERKDADLLFYRIRQMPEINMEGLVRALEGIGFTMGPSHGWVQKAIYDGKGVDLFFPEGGDGDYPVMLTPEVAFLDEVPL